MRRSSGRRESEDQEEGEEDGKEGGENGGGAATEKGQGFLVIAASAMAGGIGSERQEVDTVGGREYEKKGRKSRGKSHSSSPREESRGTSRGRGQYYDSEPEFLGHANRKAKNGQ